MVDPTRRRKYRYDRILIETERILSPQFNSAFLYVTGAQLELLRNVVAYLRRLETYVSEYNPGYYLTPTAEDYDDLLALVADLEDILMASDNAPWKITGHFSYSEGDNDADEGHNTIGFTSVPADEVWIVEAIQGQDVDSVITRIELTAIVDWGAVQLAKHLNPATAEQHAWAGHITLQENDFIRVEFYGCTAGDDLSARIIGYVMTVPD